ncbi:MAG: exodeoxyribonuclease VII small subunit [Candidatus Aminicenantes bacterium]|jgi:exodeoxyribonuclease VII small subunit|nr:exodeoxyribonuclease VII small subunit [Candidatus Aminicenantes bacterium]
MTDKSGSYEKNYQILEKITESLNKDEIGIDDLVEKTKEALHSARICMEILKKQKGEFKKLEVDFSQLLRDSGKEESQAPGETKVGDDSPF